MTNAEMRTEIDKCIAFVNEAKGVLDADKRKFFEERIKGFEAGKGMLEESERYHAYLLEQVAKEANRAAFHVFIERDVKNDMLLDDYKKVIGVRDAEKLGDKFIEEDKDLQAQIQKLGEQYQEIHRPFGIFMAVCNGTSKEEAEARQRAYDAKARETIQNM